MARPGRRPGRQPRSSRITEPDPEPPPTEILKPSRAGRNLRAAIAVGLVLGGLALLTLFTVKVIFLIYMAAVVALGLWELTRALEARGIRLPLIPVAAGGAVMLGLAYYSGERPLLAALAVTVIAVMAWRMTGGNAGYLRDVTAGVFTLVYLPLMASFVALMLAAPDGSRRVLAWIVVTVCSDIGGYLVGSLLGRHPDGRGDQPAQDLGRLRRIGAGLRRGRSPAADPAAARHLVAGRHPGRGRGRLRRPSVTWPNP